MNDHPTLEQRLDAAIAAIQAEIDANDAEIARLRASQPKPTDAHAELAFARFAMRNTFGGQHEHGTEHDTDRLTDQIRSS